MPTLNEVVHGPSKAKPKKKAKKKTKPKSKKE